MTKQLVEFQLDDGTPIVFETSEDIPSGGTVVAVPMALWRPPNPRTMGSGHH